MLIRPAKKQDYPQILEILKELDEEYQGFKPNSFWVADDNGIVGAVRLEEAPSFVFLESLAVKKDQQNQGIARKLLEAALKPIKKEIYLYTIIPNFFKKFGFKPITPAPTFLPGKERYECQFCEPKKCVTMVKHA